MSIKSKSEGWKYITCGLILILLKILSHYVHVFTITDKNILYIQEIFFELVGHIGIGLFVLGSLTMILDLGHWTEYFEQRLISVVKKSEFLAKLSKDDLTTLQADIFKVIFNNNKIANGEGFLEYYNKNIKDLIGMPFRTDVNLTLNISESLIDKRKFDVIETMSYICRSNGTNIQDNISYAPDEDEHSQTIDYLLTLSHPDFELLSNNHSRNSITFDNKKLKDVKALLNENDFNAGFNFKLQDFRKENLSVSLRVKYSVFKHRFIGWRMSHPTNNLTIQMNYPANYKLTRELFYSENNHTFEENTHGTGSFTLIVRDWILPDEGVAIQLSDEIDIKVVNDNTEQTRPIKTEDTPPELI